MAEIGAFGFLPFGGDFSPGIMFRLLLNGADTQNMYTLNNASCYRFHATTTKDVKSVNISWYNIVGGPPTMNLSIEPITDGKPTGTPYDAAATKSFNPSAAATWQTVTFDTLPTTGMTVGNEYGIVIINTANNGCTNATIRHYMAVSGYPITAMYAADGTTRANLAEVGSSGSIPVCTLVFDDDTEESLGMFPFAVTNTAFLIYGADRWVGSLITVPTGIQIKVRGIYVNYVSGSGTPASRGDLRVRILDSTNGVELTRTFDRDSLQSLQYKRMEVIFEPVTLAAGTHRVVLDSSGSDVTNNWTFKGCQASSSKFVPSSCIWTSCTDGSTGPTWSNDSTVFSPISLLLDDISSTGGTTESFTGTLINRGIQ